MLIIGPLIVCGFVFFFSQSVFANIATIFYLSVLTTIICFYVANNYKLILFKLGYSPVYKPIAPQPLHIARVARLISFKIRL